MEIGSLLLVSRHVAVKFQFATLTLMMCLVEYDAGLVGIVPATGLAPALLV